MNLDIEPYVTDANEDLTAAFTFEPWTDGHALGFKVTRHSDDAVGYVYLNPSTDTWNSDTVENGGFNPDVFVYMGAYGNPANDTSRHFYNIEFAPEAT